AEDDAGQRLDLQVLHGVALLLREVAHLRLREFDVVEVALADVRDGFIDLGRREAEVLRLPVVEFLRQLADGHVAVLFYLSKDALAGRAPLGVGLFNGGRIHSAFEEAGHKTSSQYEAPGYLIACGLIGEPVPPVMMSGGPQKKNSYTPSASQSSASSLR